MHSNPSATPHDGQALLERLGWPVYARGEKGIYTVTAGDGALRSGIVVEPKGLSAYVEVIYEGKPLRLLEAAWDHEGQPLSLRLHGEEVDAAGSERAFLDQTAVLREAPSGRRGSYVCMGRLKPAGEATRTVPGLR